MLYIEIFKIDWLFIDTVLIILLLSILLIVKIFKSKSRWRFSFSNKSLLRIKIQPAYLNDKKFIYSFQKIHLIRNKNLEDTQRPKIGIITFSLKNQSKLNRLISKGLASYGFDVINLKLRTTNVYSHIKEEVYEIQIKNLLTSLKIVLQKNKIFAESYLIILDFKSNFFISKVIIEQENDFILLINPDINENYKKTILTSFLKEKTIKKFLIIFSKKKLFIFNNKNMLQFLKLIPDYKKRNINIKILEKCHKSFKYYETLLLGIIIDFLESGI